MFLPPKSTQIRALADCDSFFASCEVARRPELRGKPVCACRSDIVLAATYEAKKYGVRTATAVREAKKMLAGTGAVFIPTDMPYYERISRKIFTLLAQSSTQREQYSVDEAFFERSGLCRPTDAYQYAHDLQAKILQATQMPLSIGVGPTRIIAKIFAKLNKPYGIVSEFDHTAIYDRIGSLPLQEVPFVGRKRIKKFFSGATIGDFISMPGEEIKKRLGREGLKLRLELRGHEAVRIDRKGGPSSIGRARSFHPHFTSDKDILRNRLLNNFEKVYVDLTKEGLMTSSIHVSLKTKQFTYTKYSLKLPGPLIERAQLIQSMRHCFEQCRVSGVMYRQTVVVCSELTYQDDYYTQSSLRQSPTQDTSISQQHLQSIITSLNTKFGSRIITTASNHTQITHSPDTIGLGGVVS